jgi:hypothetical protein
MQLNLLAKPGFSRAINYIAHGSVQPASVESLAPVWGILQPNGRKLQHDLRQFAEKDKFLHGTFMVHLPDLQRTYIKSSCGDEAGLPLALDHSGDYRLPSQAFVDWLRLRILAPVHPGRTVCVLCGKTDVDESMVHDLNCPKGQACVTHRHTMLDTAFRDVVGLNKHPKVAINPGVPLLSDTFAEIVGRVRGEKEKTVSGDVGILLPEELVELGRLHAVDFTIAGPTVANLTEAMITTGSMAKAAEKRKWTELKAVFHVPESMVPFFIPAAVEITGTFGHEIRAFLPKLLPRAPPQNASPEVVAEHVLAHNRRLGNIKAAMVMAVIRGNHHILNFYRLRLGVKMKSTQIVPIPVDLDG